MLGTVMATNTGYKHGPTPTVREYNSSRSDPEAKHTSTTYALNGRSLRIYYR